MTKKEEKLKKIYDQQEVDNSEANLNRGRSITVGTCFGGMTELMMRDSSGKVIWLPMQPVEVVELIHQLAANIGCHINIVPRNDFASWRIWNYTQEELEHYRGVQSLPGVGHAPHSNDMTPHKDIGRISENEANLRLEVSTKEITDESLAVKKIINKRATKRTSTSS